MRGIIVILLGSLVFVMLLNWLIQAPIISDFSPHIQPATYDEAVNQFKDIQAQEQVGLNPLCHSVLLTHGKQTAKVIAFIHGYTNCPAQFELLGQQFYERGYNVLILRLPQHGLADRMTTQLTNFTAESMISYVDEVTNISRGLGEHVTLAGLSGGGVMVGWAVQERPDVDQAVLIAPSFSLKAIPDFLTALTVKINLLLPDRFSWWDIVHKDTQGIANSYPRYSWHGLVEQLRLSLATRQLAKTSPPAAKTILVITNANDEAVDNGVIKKVVDAWRAHGAVVTTYEFPAELHLRHDLIDPHQSYQHPEAVYPQLVKLIDQ